MATITTTPRATPMHTTDYFTVGSVLRVRTAATATNKNIHYYVPPHR